MATMLMFTGIALLGTVAASLASFFSESRREQAEAAEESDPS